MAGRYEYGICEDCKYFDRCPRGGKALADDYCPDYAEEDE